MPIAMIRHGSYHQPNKVPSAWLPHGLDALGEEQSRSAASKIIAFCAEYDLQLDPVLDCSRMLRAWQTASILAEELGRSTRTEFIVCEFEALAERSVGSLANLTTDEIAAVLRDDPRCPKLPDDWKRDTDFRLPTQGAESFREAGLRVARHAKARYVEAPKLKLLIGHGGSFRHAAMELGVLEASEVARRSMFHAEPVILQRGARGWSHMAGQWKTRSGELD